MLVKLDKKQTSGEVGRAVSIGREHHGHYTVMPRIGVIDEPKVFNGWGFGDIKMDDSEIPKEAERHVQILRDNGIVILQVIVGHNLVEEAEKEKKIEAYREKLEQIGKVGSGAAVAALGLLTWLASAAATLILGLITLVLAVDPVLIVVLEDGTWLCVAEWDS